MTIKNISRAQRANYRLILLIPQAGVTQESFVGSYSGQGPRVCVHIWDLSRSFGKISVQEGRRFIGQIGACKYVTSGLVYAVPARESRLKSGSNVGGVLLIPKQRMDKRLEERQEVPPGILGFPWSSTTESGIGLCF